MLVHNNTVLFFGKYTPKNNVPEGELDRGYIAKSGQTELYCLRRRYYDPQVGRFINADSQIAGVGGDILGCNIFAYCLNNPVNMVDVFGFYPKFLLELVTTASEFVNTPLGIMQYIKNITEKANYMNFGWMKKV